MTSSKIGTDVQTGQIVEIPKTSRLQGLYIIGLQGYGKSGLIENLIIQDIRQQIGVCVLDPHGELVDHVIARLPGMEAEEKVIYLDLTDSTYPFGLNLFECSDPTNDGEIVQTLSHVLHVFEKAYAISWNTPLMYDLLYNSAYTLIANPGYSMIDIRLLLTNEACRKKLVQNVPMDDVLTFWNRWDDPKQKSLRDQQEDSQTILNKLNDFSHAPLRNIVGQSSSTIKFQDIMNDGKILLVKLNRRLENPSSLIGSIIISQLLNAAYDRPAHKRKQFNLYADEFQRFATEDFATLLEEARKYAIGTTIAHQNRGQLDTKNSQLETNLKDRTRSVANLVMFKINSKDAAELAGEFDCTPVRTKKVLKQRTEPKYKEWDEKIWTSAEAKQQYEDQEIILKTLLPKKREQLAVLVTLDNCFEIAFSRLFYEFSDETMKEVYQEFPSLYHYPFNPHYGDVNYGYWWKNSLKTGMTDGGLVCIREADLSRHFARNRGNHAIPLCEGYRFKREVTATFESYAQRELERCYYALLKGTDEEVRFFIEETGHEIHGTLGYVNRKEAAKAVLEVIEELKLVINPLYDDAIFWFEPTSCNDRGYCTCKTDPMNCPDNNLCNCRKCQQLRATTPSIGGERTNKGAHGEDWPALGMWEYTMFPQALAWIIKFAKQKYEEKWRLIQEIKSEQEAYRQKMRELYQTYRTTIHHKEYLGEQPVKVQKTQVVGERSTRFGREQIERITDIQWYDLVEELDQTHDQRRDEIANELNNLPMYTAQVRFAIEEKPVEHTIKTLDPKEQPERPLFGQALQERLARIKKQNIHEGYLREKTKVEEEIRLRQEQFREPPEEPPISRRQPRQ